MLQVKYHHINTARNWPDTLDSIQFPYRRHYKIQFSGYQLHLFCHGWLLTQLLAPQQSTAISCTLNFKSGVKRGLYQSRSCYQQIHWVVVPHEYIPNYQYWGIQSDIVIFAAVLSCYFRSEIIHDFQCCNGTVSAVRNNKRKLFLKDVLYSGTVLSSRALETIIKNRNDQTIIQYSDSPAVVVLTSLEIKSCLSDTETTLRKNAVDSKVRPPKSGRTKPIFSTTVFRTLSDWYQTNLISHPRHSLIFIIHFVNNALGQPWNVQIIIWPACENSAGPQVFSF